MDYQNNYIHWEKSIVNLNKHLLTVSKYLFNKKKCWNDC